jgi:Ca2+-transporting ATPase
MMVPGDVVLLEAGNRIPLISFYRNQLKVDESTLTGESNTIDKTSEKLPAGEYSRGLQQFSFKGTLSGHGSLCHGNRYGTELGHIAQMIQSQDSSTPLQIRLAAFGKRLSFS